MIHLLAICALSGVPEIWTGVHFAQCECTECRHMVRMRRVRSLTYVRDVDQGPFAVVASIVLATPFSNWHRREAPRSRVHPRERLTEMTIIHQ